MYIKTYVELCGLQGFMHSTSSVARIPIVLSKIVPLNANVSQLGDF